MSEMAPPRKVGALARWFGVRPGELHTLASASAVFFCVNGSGVLFNNFAETAFLKRLGVHYLPIVLVVNALLTFVVMGVLGGWLARIRPEVLLRRVLIGCGLSAGLVRLVIPLGIAGIYPILYLMKTQFNLTLTFLFWNLANERFSTRQSKHLFPLITAGGILGGVVGSFCTPFLARSFGVNELLWLYAGALVIAEWVVARGPASSPPRGGAARLPGLAAFTVVTEIKNAVPVLQRSTLARLLILLALLPNIVTPILGYQFSFLVDRSYYNEASMLGFYSLFRGVQNLLTLGISVFAGRLYKRVGIPGSLLIHPANYVLVFAVLALRFDLLAAIYAGLSVGILRRSIQTPARAALMGLFSTRDRVALLPFLRGAVVRGGALLGSVAVLICQSGYFVVCRRPLHPRNLAPIGILVAASWFTAAMRLFQLYPRLLLEMLGAMPPGGGRGIIAFPPDQAHGWRQRLARARQTLRRGHRLATRGRQETADQLRCTAQEIGRRVFAEMVAEDPTGSLRTIARSLEDATPRTRANALEALEAILPRGLASRLVPLLEDPVADSPEPHDLPAADSPPPRATIP